MQEASVPGLIKTIIYIIGFYYLVKILARIFMPILMKSMMNKAQESFNRQYQQGNFNQSTTNDTFNQEKTQRDFKKPTKQVGEYVDYEEVND
ncbi:protein of unknown function [Flavobacterium terrae]|uniref:DUF4834 domain-containing protein n=2 Tax=Flavobacterium terrae TaxID=415425 RepID=A0A1M6CKX0_9FLAO|nr:protein of unknown function [Flavobacterium terrae]